MKTFLLSRWGGKLLHCVLFVFLSFQSAYSKSPVSYGEAWVKASSIRNFSDFSETDKEAIVAQIMDWENNNEDFLQIPYSEILPHTLVSLTNSSRDYNLIKSSPFKSEHRQLNWIPSVSLFYELMIVHHQMQYEYGSAKCPPLPMIMALLSHETYMRNVKGDGGLSVGMCQLYRPSALYLTKKSKNKELFNQLISFDSEGNHHFRSQRKMIEFVYHFLVKEKGYTNLKQEKGLSAYNGGGKMARRYGKIVLMKSIFYEGLILSLKAQSPKIASKRLEEWSERDLPSFVIGMDAFHESKDTETYYPLSQGEIQDLHIFRYEVIQFLMEIAEQKPKYEMPPYTLSKVTFNMEKGPIQGIGVSFLENMPRLGNEMASEGNYLVIPQGRTIFSIFRSNTFQVMALENDYPFFYYNKGDKKLVPTERDMAEKLGLGHVILSSAVAGDTVYVPKGTPLYAENF